MSSTRAALTLGAMMCVAACADISFVDVEDVTPPPVQARAYLSLEFRSTQTDALTVATFAYFQDWGEEPPFFAVGAGQMQQVDGSYGSNGHHYTGHDTVSVDAPSLIGRILITPPGESDAAPDTIALPTLHRVRRTVLCPDSAGSITVGAEVGGATDGTRISWSLWIESRGNGAADRRVSWAGEGESVVTIPLAGLPDADTLFASLYLSVGRNSSSRSGVPVETRTSLAEDYLVARTGC